MTKKELAAKYIQENPDMFKRELARKMHQERPDIWGNIETARKAVRSVINGDSKRDRHSGWSLGCLCDLRPDYRPFAFTKWNHGAAVVNVSENGNFHVDAFTIINGKVI